MRAVCRITRKHGRKSQTKSQRDPISDRVEQRQATAQQFRAHQATSSRISGFTDTEEVTGSIPVPPTSSTRQNSQVREPRAGYSGGLSATGTAQRAASARARITRGRANQTRVDRRANAVQTSASAQTRVLLRRQIKVSLPAEALGTPTAAQWSRIKAGRNDDLGASSDDQH